MAKKDIDPRIVTTNNIGHFGTVSAKQLEEDIKSAQAEEAKEQARIAAEQSNA